MQSNRPAGRHFRSTRIIRLSSLNRRFSRIFLNGLRPCKEAACEGTRHGAEDSSGSDHSATLHCEHGNIVVLSEQLRCFSDLAGGITAHRSDAIKAEEFAGIAARFDNTVGDEGELCVGGKMKIASGYDAAATSPSGRLLSTASSAPLR